MGAIKKADGKQYLLIPSSYKDSDFVMMREEYLDQGGAWRRYLIKDEHGEWKLTKYITFPYEVIPQLIQELSVIYDGHVYGEAIPEEPEEVSEEVSEETSEEEDEW